MIADGEAHGTLRVAPPAPDMLRAIASYVACSIAAGQAPTPLPPAVALFADGVQVGTERWTGQGAGTASVAREETVTTWEPWTWIRHRARNDVTGETKHAGGRLVGFTTTTRIGPSSVEATVSIGDSGATWSVGGTTTTAPVPDGVPLVPDGCIGPLLAVLRDAAPSAVALLQPSSPHIAIGRVGPGPAARLSGHETVALRSLRVRFDAFWIDVWFAGDEPIAARDSRTGIEARAANARVAPPDQHITQAPMAVLEEDCTFAAGGTHLFGVLTRPRATQPIAVALLLSGSGPDAEDAPIGGRPFLAAIAWRLSAAGLATLRVADRGVGRSGGTFTGIRVADLAADAKAALAFLRQRHPDLPALLVGHSEGALIAALVANDTAARGVVLLACPAKPVTQAIVEQTPALLDGLGGIAIEEAERLAAFFARAAATEGATLTTDAGDVVPIGWIKDHAALQPSELVASLRCGVAILHGTADRQVPVAAADALAAAMRAAGRAEPRVRRLPELDHAFARATDHAGGPDSSLLDAVCDGVTSLLR